MVGGWWLVVDFPEWDFQLYFRQCRLFQVRVVFEIFLAGHAACDRPYPQASQKPNLWKCRFLQLEPMYKPSRTSCEKPSQNVPQKCFLAEARIRAFA